MRVSLAIVLATMVVLMQPSRLLAAGPNGGFDSEVRPRRGHERGQVPPVTPPVAPHRGRGPQLRPILIGASIGAGLYGWLCYKYSEESSRGTAAFKGALGGAAAGATIGFVISSR